MRRKGERETQVVRARVTVFSNAFIAVVGSGPRITVPELGTKHAETFTILGAWDSEPDKGIVTYLTPLAQSLLNRKVGEEVEFELDGAKKHFRIEAIEAYAPAQPDVAKPAQAAPGQ